MRSLNFISKVELFVRARFGTSYKGQTFPIICPISLGLRSYKPRKVVHLDGSWHIGIQANIIRKNKQGSFDILIQKRSQIVDLSPGCLDQSLAVQLLKKDGFHFEKALFRGLREELGIERAQIKKMKLVTNLNLAILKRYKPRQAFTNRERIFLYLIELNQKVQPKIHSKKVDELFWISWSELKKAIQKNETAFTKTACFYFGYKPILDEIEIQSMRILSIPLTSKGREQDNIQNFFVVNINDCSKIKYFCLPITGEQNLMESFNEIIQRVE